MKRVSYWFSWSLVCLISSFSCKEDVGYISVSEIKTEHAEYVLAVGELYFVKTVLLPESASHVRQTWTSDTPDVASVEGGEITGIGEGTATITLTAGDKSVSFKVTVTASKIDVEDVVFDRYELSITEGETLPIAATVLPQNATNKSLIWTSDNEVVATVSEEGVISALQEGVAYITATSTDSGKKTSAKVMVERKGRVLEVRLDRSSLSLGIGQSGSLIATVLPEDAENKNVTWHSDNPAVAAVDQTGQVTGVSAGEANITVTSVDGGKTATCRVSVLLIYTDNFDRADTGLKNPGEFIDPAKSWSITQGSFGIVNQSLKAVKGGTPAQSVIFYKAQGAITKNAGGSFKMIVDMKPKVASSWAGIIFNAQDDNRYYVFRVRVASANVQFLSTVDNGSTWTVLTSQVISAASTFAAGQTYRFILISTGAGKYRIKITNLDETANYGEFNLTDNAAAYSNGYAGLWGQFDELLFDNFYLSIN